MKCTALFRFTERHFFQKKMFISSWEKGYLILRTLVIEEKAFISPVSMPHDIFHSQWKFGLVSMGFLTSFYIGSLIIYLLEKFWAWCYAERLYIKT